MVFKPTMKFPLKKIQISRVVFISGLLTFIYCIEFCIGIRTIYYAFKLWNDSQNQSQDRRVSWILCVGCLFAATITAFTVNILSAMWEEKQLEEREKAKSTIRFTFHILIGGVIWRYVNLWFIESKEFQKKNALLLTMTKFFFTQTFTIPMVIVHVSVMGHLEELVYDVCSIFCISINLILTCTMFAWCSNEVEELKKWDFETVNLIPLIFQTSPTVATGCEEKSNKDSTGKEVVSKSEKKAANSTEFEDTIIRTIVFFQSFGFSLGRILALGILVKLAGIYAVSIMFLQLLISVIYLKFQSPILVSDSLPKWRQLCRLAFMSYILIFEWHLNREPNTAYDFSFSMKHSIFYYCAATVESVFYLVTWAITTNYSSKSLSNVARREQNKFCRIILVIGTMALVFSLTLHILLLFWRSRKMSQFLYSVRRRYENTKIRLSRYGCGNQKEVQENTPKRAHVDISSPIPMKKNDDERQETNSLGKHNSYRDLREPLDEEIDICFRKCDNHGKYSNGELGNDNVKNIAKSEEVAVTFNKRTIAKTMNSPPSRKMNIVQCNASDTSEQMNNAPTIVPNDSKEFSGAAKPKDETVESTPEKSLKSKMALISETFSEKWGRFSSVSRKFAGTVKDQFKKGKLQNSSASESKTAESPTKEKPFPTDEISSYASQNSTESVEGTEDYFVGDARCYQIESDQTVPAKRIRFTEETVSQLKTFGKETDDEILPASDTNHRGGDAPCPCYICKTLGDGRFRRRRSSSVPPADRKMNREDTDGTSERYMSTPNISQDHFEKNFKDHNGAQKNISSPAKFTKNAFSLSALSVSSIEQFV